MIVQTIEISLSKGRAPELLAHLGESNRQIEMVPDVELPETAGAEIDIVKPDGTFAIQTADITDGHIIVTLPDQACTVKGLSHYILKITDTGTVIYSAYGNIFVDDHLITDAMIESIAEANGYKFPDDFLTDDKLEANPSGSATDTLYRLKIFDTIYGLSGGGGGADVEANPTGTPTDTLDALRVDDIIYEVEKPIPVEANPAGVPSYTLDSLKVGSDIYEVRRGIIYSTTEQVIGTWIDGSTLYQITINIPNFRANQYEDHISKSYYGYLDISAYVPNPAHIFCDIVKSFITLEDTTTRTPIYVDWQSGTTMAIFFPYVARSGTLTLTMTYTKA